MKILLTGGLGYIGSHTCLDLIQNQHNPIIVDNLKNSNHDILRRLESLSQRTIPFYQVDIRDQASLDGIFQEHQIDAIIHFAALKSVNDSIKHIDEYYDVNISGSVTLLNLAIKNNVKKFLFSSSAAVYGDPQSAPINEEHSTSPLSPYGNTKLIFEKILEDYCNQIPSLTGIALRYFNPVGADKSSMIGENPKDKPNNLMPIICEAAAHNTSIKIFGDNYDTKDGTGVRDYIHVSDLASAHTRTLKLLKDRNKKKPFDVFNVGTGIGYSVLEILRTFEKVNSIKIRHTIEDRRPGDVSKSYADNSKMLTHYGWVPQKTLEEMCRSAWVWYQSAII